MVRLGIGAADLHLAHPVAARRGRDDDALGRRGVDLGEQLHLEVEVLGCALLHELGVCQRPLQQRLDAQPGPIGSFSETELGQRRPRGIDEVLEAFRGVGSRVPGNDVVAVREEVRRPTAPDDTGPDAAHRADIGHRNGGSGHADFGFRLRISRPSSGVATEAPIDSTMVRARSTSCALVALTPLLR